MNKWHTLGYSILFFAATCLAEAKQDSIKLTSLDWLPYTGVDLEGGGPITRKINHVFKNAGIETEVIFYPWKRAIRAVKDSTSYVAYFPGYRSKTAERDFLLSDAFGASPLGVIALNDESLQESDIADLTKYRVGVVAGYNNTHDFDTNVKSGAQKVEVSSDDTTLIRKVAQGRVKLALIDRYVLDYLLENDPALTPFKDKISFVKTLETKKLHLCFEKSETGQKLRTAFNAELKKLDQSGMHFELASRP